jgi:hypothetical protein
MQYQALWIQRSKLAHAAADRGHPYRWFVEPRHAFSHVTSAVVIDPDTPFASQVGQLARRSSGELSIYVRNAVGVVHLDAHDGGIRQHPGVVRSTSSAQTFTAYPTVSMLSAARFWPFPRGS